MKRFASLLVIVAALMTVALLAGCEGGGDGDGGTDPNLGTVTGRVMAGRDNPVGFGNVLIQLQTQATPAVTVASGRTDANGYFTITDVPPGTYVVVVTPPDGSGFVVPPSADPIVVTVLPGDSTDIDDPIAVWDENDLPPDAPE